MLRRFSSVLRGMGCPQRVEGLSGMKDVRIHARSFGMKSTTGRVDGVDERRRGNAGRGKYPGIENLKPTLTIREFLDRFEGLEKGARVLDHEPITLSGRIVSRPRSSGKNLFFYQIQYLNERVQVLADSRHYKSKEEFRELHHALSYGDIVSVSGIPARSKMGELSIIPDSVTILAPCLHDIPSGRGDGKYALKDKSIRYQNRHIDFLANGQDVLKPFFIRTKLIRFLRSFLDERGFLEVETPILSANAGGAIAKPFRTKSKFGMDYSLRIAPELFLKQLVVGGIDRVYEIGKVFRNEGVSVKHNPEFTSCEFYQAYADYEDLMGMTETLISEMALNVIGSTKVNETIDLKPPFARISIVPALEKALDLTPGTFPDLEDPDTVQEVGDQLLRFVNVAGTEHINPKLSKMSHTVASNCKLVDALIGHYLEPLCVQPTFLCDHPTAMSPLAKQHPNNPAITQRFELFINGVEVCNAYSELNEPREQLRRFVRQRHQSINDPNLKTFVDEEEMPIDIEFCKTLEYGLPPTAGWGMGIDRMVMLFAKQDSIRDVILFPHM